MSYKIIIGCDPGVSNGGLVVYKNGKIENTIPFAKTINRKKQFVGYESIKEFLKHLKTIDDSILFGLEKINMRPPRNQAEGYKAVVMQKLFKHVSMLEIIVKDLGIDFIEVPVISWITTMNLKKTNPDETDTERKNRYKERAKLAHPYINVTAWNADAILILEHLIRKLMFDPSWFDKFKIQKKQQNLF